MRICVCISYMLKGREFRAKGELKFMLSGLGLNVRSGLIVCFRLGSYWFKEGRVEFKNEDQEVGFLFEPVASGDRR